jgi:D-alanyl-D-alanine carboxypeptidase
MKTKIFISILLTAFITSFAYSQPFNKAKLDSLFNRLAETNKAMGSLTLSKNGNIIYSKTIGYSLISEKEKKAATAASKYRIGSITKIFTATMIFQLVEEGKLKLATTLDTYFPTIPNAGKITISNLLNHRSGIHNFTNDPGYTSMMTQPKTQSELLALFSSNKSDFEPNEKGSYSNTNYVLLGYIIEKVTGKSYSTNLKERITSKIGITNTYCGGKIDSRNNECYSYQFLSNWKQMPETDMSIPGGAGSVVSTTADLTKFIEALFTGKLVSQNSLNQMKTTTDECGMGMFKMPFNEKMAYGHNGGIDGFASNLAYFPDDGLAIAFCSNGMAYSMNDLLIGVLSIYFNFDYKIPSFKILSLKPAELDKYTGVYSSTQLPLKITITRENSTLIAQATGQSSFSLDPTDKDIFKFDPAGVVMEFDLVKHEMTLKQGGGVFVFTRN